MRRLDGKVAVITGGSGGIGLAAGHLFAREGAKVLLVDLQEEPLRHAVQSIGAAVASYVHVAMLSTFLERRVGSLIGKASRTFVTAFAGALVAGAAAWGVLQVASIAPLWVGSLATITTFVIVYGIVTLVLKHPVAQEIARFPRS